MGIKENRLFDFPFIDFSESIPLSRQIEYRQLLETVSLRNYDNDQLLGLFQSSFSHALMQFLISSESLIQGGTTFNLQRETSFRTEVISFQKNLPQHLERLIISFFTEKNAQYGLFERLRKQLLNNADIASGFPPDRSYEEREKKPITLPTNSKLEGKALVEAYLSDTDLLSLFSATVPFTIPIQARLEHTHIIAGTGHGKTQLIQHLILDDIATGRGFMVIDSQGDMLQKIIMRKQFEPGLEGSLSDKLVYINPENIDFPAALNMFSLHNQGDDVSGLDKQILINAAVDMYQYLFGALFGAELTAKQGIIFRYLAKLMAEIPDATIHTLRALLEDARPYKPYMEKLEGSAKAFFQKQFFSSSFNQTKSQVLSRLWMVLSNQSLENLFSSKTNSVDLVEALNEGKIVLVNTSKRLLQDYGSQTLGRFFIALLSQAVIQRGAIPESLRNPYMVYIDEAHEYIDEKIEVMLNQARKYGVGFCLSHQNLNQLGTHKHTVSSSTTVKLAGGVSAKDASDLASEMKSSSQQLLSMQKSDSRAEFTCYIKNQLPHAIALSYPFGQLEQSSMISKEGYVKLDAMNREKYCVPVETLSFSDSVIDGYVKEQETKKASKREERQTTQKAKPPLDEKVESRKEAQDKPDFADKVQAPKEDGGETIPKKKGSAKNIPKKETVKPKVIDIPPEGKGGTTHRHLQNLIKRIGQQRGFHTIIESPVFDGLGSVDVSLEGFERKIAIEVSVTTQGKWEASNIVKCLSAGFDTVIIVTTEKEHLAKIQNDIADEFTEQIASEKLIFLQPKQLTHYLDTIKAESASTEKRISGYRVKTTFVVSNEHETKLREEALAKILLSKR